jgi:hypothetical protein
MVANLFGLPTTGRFLEESKMCKRIILLLFHRLIFLYEGFSCTWHLSGLSIIGFGSSIIGSTHGSTWKVLFIDHNCRAEVCAADRGQDQTSVINYLKNCFNLIFLRRRPSSCCEPCSPGRCGLSTTPRTEHTSSPVTTGLVT